MWDQRVQTCSVAVSPSISPQRNEVVPAALVPVGADGGAAVEVEADGTDAETGGRVQFGLEELGAVEHFTDEQMINVKFGCVGLVFVTTHRL